MKDLCLAVLTCLLIFAFLFAICYVNYPSLYKDIYCYQKLINMFEQDPEFRELSEDEKQEFLTEFIELNKDEQKKILRERFKEFNALSPERQEWFVNEIDSAARHIQFLVMIKSFTAVSIAIGVVLLIVSLGVFKLVCFIVGVIVVVKWIKRKIDEREYLTQNNKEV